ncbi:MAG: hypothetical protein ACTSP1_15825 [Candidatus Freyarchaeota archaeon]
MMNADETEKLLDEIKERIPIDRYNLDEECRRQAILYSDVGELVSEAKAEARRKEQRLELVKAELDSKIRESPSNYGIEKVSNPAIEAAIIRSSEYQQALSDYIDARETADKLSVLQTAVEHRKSSLRDLVSLYIYEYYSGSHDMTKEKRHLGEVTEEEIIRKRMELDRRREEMATESEE